MAQQSKRPAEGGRRGELLAIAADLFATSGYATTTVRDIADAAGILSGSLYHHFASKEEIVDAILRGYLDETLGRYDEVVAAGKPARETFADLVSATLLGMEDHRSAMVIYQNDGRHLAALDGLAYLRDVSARLEAAWVGVLRRGVEEGEFRRSLDVPLAHRLISAALWTVASWYGQDGTHSAQQIADRYTSMLLDGVARGRRKKAKD